MPYGDWSYPDSFDVIGPSPDEGPFHSCQFNESYLSLLEGLIDKLKYPDVWQGTPEEIETMLQKLSELQNQIATPVIEGDTVNYALIRDEKTQNTAGGTFTSGAWQDRPLNTIDIDEIGISLSGGGIVLPGGDYRIHARLKGNYCGYHMARVVIDLATDEIIAYGTSEYAGNTTAQNEQSDSVIIAAFTLEDEQTIKLQHRCTATRASNGWGLATNLAAETYVICELWQL